MRDYATDWDTLTKRYMSYMRFEKNLAKNTVESYERDLRQFRDYIEREFEVEASKVSPSHIESFMGEVYDRGMEASSQARILSGVSNFFSFLMFVGVIEASPTELIDAPQSRRKLPDVLTVEEIDAMLGVIDLSAAQGHRNKAMLETLYSCGLRVSELISLRLQDLFFEDDFIRVTGKGDKQRVVPLSEAAKHNITLWLEQRKTMNVDAKSADILFLNQRGKKLSRVMIFTIVKQVTELAGIHKNVSPHTLRHSFATHLLQGGASIRQVQQMLGHESILTTEIYTHLDRSHLHESVKKHHPLGD